MRVRHRFWAASSVVALVASAAVMASGPARADPAPSPVPDGVYLSSSWIKPGETVWASFVGDSGCESIQSAVFNGSAGPTTIPVQGFGDGYWITRGLAFVDAQNKPLPLGNGFAERGDLVLTCAPSGGGATNTLTFRLTVSTLPQPSIYHSATAWTWYTPGSVTTGAKVRINALGFHPGEGTTVSILNATKFYGPGGGDLSAAGAAPVEVAADGEGAVTAEVTVPAGWTSTDELNVVVSGMIDRYLLVSDGGEPINGVPSLGLSAPGAAVAGGTVTVKAAGYVAGETVAVALHSETAPAVLLRALTADASGAISGQVNLPNGITPGSYRIWAGAQAISYLLLNDPLTIAETARIQAPDRFSNAVEIAKQAFPSGAPVVYVATGLNYPDALGAGAAAASAGGPLLLTAPTELPAAVKAEIEFLGPQRIVVVGGPNSVSPAVFSQLQGMAPTVDRQGGADRYEASRNIVTGQFDHATTAFIATGANFPDALSATSAAASLDAPVVLIPGSNASVDQPTLDLLDSRGVTDVTITGGPNSVSPAIETQLKTKYGADHVTRIGGADRFEASTAINTTYFASASEAFLATGSNFPDALAGGVLAAVRSAPLLVVHGDCVPASALDALQSWGVTKVTLIGGPASLTSAVSRLQTCS
ncbi:cell wall-binding repeat-containing protein [Herbiconiux sp. UC225_62]|uniref:cell wall-binding repeat-containing protein n=1 Tax=Herbiconiux sp. UC225_62 TaxID=3350168 RepID=UPI0036D43B55